jgi:DNA-binding CsgD family transcriptional regulator
MRRITMEFNYQTAWKQIFSSNADKVEVLEALRCFKCDAQGLALICRIRLKDKSMSVTDLLHKGLITNIETLYTEKDGSIVVFIEGRSCACVPPPPKDMKMPKMLMARPPDFLDIDRMKVELVGKEKEIKEFLQYANKWSNNSFKILGLTSIDTKGESLLSKLTPRQRQMLLTAYALGYYDVPRKISSDDLSRHLNVDKSTIVEHLRKAERKLMGGIIAG